MGEQQAEPQDRQWLERAAAGDGQAWRRLVETYTGRVYGLMLRHCGDAELAEELTQDTFVTVAEQILGREGDGGYQERGRFRPWLFRIAMNKLRDEMRRRGRQATGIGGGQMTSPRADGSGWAMEQAMTLASHDQRASDPAEQTSHAEQVERLRQAVDRLNEADRLVLQLRHTAGLSFAEIAKTLDQPIGTVLARAHRAVGKLRAEMEKDEVESKH